jgi:hypothetical protein
VKLQFAQPLGRIQNGKRQVERNIRKKNAIKMYEKR